MLIILHVVMYFHIMIFQIMSQSTSFLMRKYRTCSLIIISITREKHSLRESVRWAQKTIQSEVSSPDGTKFKPETNIQVMDTIPDVTKASQLITKDVYIPLNSAFWNKDEFNNKMQHSSPTENCPITLGTHFVLKM